MVFGSPASAAAPLRFNLGEVGTHGETGEIQGDSGGFEGETREMEGLTKDVA